MKVLPAGLIISLLLAAASDGQTVGGTWQQLASMPTARQELASAVLNGKIYVIGGLNADGISTNTVEVYNPATNTWTSAQPLPLANRSQQRGRGGGKTLFSER